MTQTNDVQVLGVLSDKKALSSAGVAGKLGLTAFQITARLASMEKRGLVKRDNGNWLRLVSPDQAKVMAEKSSAPSKNRGTIIVDMDDATARRDAKAPRISSDGWKCNAFWVTGDQRILVFTSLDRKHYVYAEPSETADVLVDKRADGYGLIRMKHFVAGCYAYRRLIKDHGKQLAKLGII